MAKRNGVDLLIYILSGSIDKAIAGSVDNTLSVNGSPIDVSTKDSAGFRELLMGQLSWSMSGSGNFDNDVSFGFNDLMDAMLNKEEVVVKFSFEESGVPAWQGSAYLSSLELTAPNEDKVTFSFTLEGTGALTEV